MNDIRVGEIIVELPPRSHLWIIGRLVNWWRKRRAWKQRMRVVQVESQFVNITTPNPDTFRRSIQQIERDLRRKES